MPNSKKDDWVLWGAGLAGLIALGYMISTAKPAGGSSSGMDGTKPCETCGKTEEEKANAKEPPCGCNASK